MEEDITSGANKEDVLAYAERLNIYVEEEIILPLINDLGYIFNFALYYYWCSAVAVNFRNITVTGTKDTVKKILEYQHTIRNNVYSAYNFWAASNSGKNEPDTISYDDAEVGCNIYDEIIETKLVKLREKNNAGSFGMNKSQVNNVVLPKIETLKNDLEAACLGIPMDNLGVFDDEKAQAGAYETNLRVIKSLITQLVGGILNSITEQIKTEEDNNTLAKNQSSNILRG